MFAVKCNVLIVIQDRIYEKLININRGTTFFCYFQMVGLLNLK